MKNTIIAIVAIIVLAGIWYAVKGTDTDDVMKNVENTNTETVAKDATPTVDNSTVSGDNSATMNAEIKQ